MVTVVAITIIIIRVLLNEYCLACIVSKNKSKELEKLSTMVGDWKMMKKSVRIKHWIMLAFKLTVYQMNNQNFINICLSYNVQAVLLWLKLRHKCTWQVGLPGASFTVIHFDILSTWESSWRSITHRAFLSCINCDICNLFWQTCLKFFLRKNDSLTSMSIMLYSCFWLYRKLTLNLIMYLTIFHYS